MSEKCVAQICPSCKQYHKVSITSKTENINCPNCNKEWGVIQNRDDIFDRCPSCGCRQFYLSKNFNQLIGCSVMLCGIILVPFTYGLSMPVFALIDWLYYKKVQMIANCYRCGLEFHGFKEQERFKPFLHHIGLKYDKYR